MTGQFYVGTDLKFLLNIEAQGFSMDSDDYEIELRCGGKRVKVSKSDIIVNGTDHYLCVNSKQFGSGLLQMVVCAYVPDSAFSDGKRTEIAVMNLCQLKNV